MKYHLFPPIALTSLWLFFTGCNHAPTSKPITTNISLSRPTPLEKGNSSENQNTVKIGVVLPLTGSQAPWGQEALKGIQLAFKNAEKNCFFKLKPLELIEEDSGSQRDGAQRATLRLIDKGVIGIIGELGSDLSLEVAKICFQKGVPMVALAATFPKLTEIGNNIFRICFTDHFQGSLLANFAFNECNIKTIGVFTAKDDMYSKCLGLNFCQAFEKLGGHVLEEYSYWSNERSFTQALKSMQQKNCQGLFVSSFFEKAKLILKQARKLKFDVYKLGGDGWDRLNLKQSINKNIVGSFYAAHYNILVERPEVQSFVSSWKKNYKMFPKESSGAVGYDAALVMSHAIKNSTKLNSLELIKALNQIEKVPGVTGKITLKNRAGNPHKPGMICTLTGKGPLFYRSYEYQKIVH